MTSSSLIVFATLAVTLAGAACAGAQSSEPDSTAAVPQTDSEKASYAMGYSVANQIRSQGLELSKEQILAGLADGFDGKDPVLPAEELQAAQQRFQQAEQARVAAQQQGDAGANRAAAEAFLAENGARAGVETIEPGLQYEVLTAGDGATPKASEQVTVHYRGTLLDGTEFDSSYARNEPVTFPLNRVIAGWTKALTQMPVGSKWKLFIAPDLAYGDTPPPGKIPAGAALIFEVELLDIVN